MPPLAAIFFDFHAFPLIFADYAAADIFFRLRRRAC